MESLRSTRAPLHHSGDTEDLRIASRGSDTLELTILMPCLNEAETMATWARKAHGFRQRTGIEGEVLVADNGSSHGSLELARAAGAPVVAIAKRGYGITGDS